MASAKRPLTGFSTSSFCGLCKWRAALAHRYIIQFYAKTADFCNNLLLFRQRRSTTNVEKMDKDVKGWLPMRPNNKTKGMVVTIKQANSCRLFCVFVVENNNPLPVADPGFPRGGGANPKGGGANLLFGQLFLKTAWKWRNFGPGGARVPRAPLRSATNYTCSDKKEHFT